jgi:hypothetical protein
MSNDKRWVASITAIRNDDDRPDNTATTMTTPNHKPHRSVDGFSEVAMTQAHKRSRLQPKQGVRQSLSASKTRRKWQTRAREPTYPTDSGDSRQNAHRLE